MRILHVISSLKMGGAESLLVDLVTTLNTTKNQHYVIYFHAGLHIQALQQHGIKLYQVKGLVCLYDPIFFIRLYRLIKSINPDCIHGWLWAANFASSIIAYVLRIPQISSLHIDHDGFIRNTLDIYSYRLATRIVPVSDGVANSLVQRHPSINKKSIQVIKNGINHEYVVQKAKHTKRMRADVHCSDEHVIIGSAGRFVPIKNYPLLINAFKQVHEQHSHARLMLMGSGPEEHALRMQAKKLGIEEEVSFIIGQDACSYYPLLDCFALSSFKEGISLALLEAMSCSLPCVVTNQELFHDVIVNKKNGLLVPCENVNALVQALTMLIEDSALAEQLGKEAYASVITSFNSKRMINEYVKLYEYISK